MTEQTARPRPTGKLVAMALTVAALGYGRGVVRADPYATGGASLLGSARPQAGLVTLYSGYRNHPLIDAEAEVWIGQGLYDESEPLRSDVLTVNVGLRDPGGHLHARLGRLLFSSGAIRPIHIDGIKLRGRSDFGTAVETFAGVPVVDSLLEGYDWVAGGRVSQRLWEERLGVGVSYVHQGRDGMLANEEVGADLSLAHGQVTLRGVGAWDLVLAGLATARVEVGVSPSDLVARLHVERRVAARLLPATSLFSVISDSANSELGADVDYQWFPRLSVGATGNLQWIDVDQAPDRGYQLGLRSRLELGEADEGDILLMVSRRGGFDAAYNAVYVAIERKLSEALRVHAASELVAADNPGEDGKLWPYLNVGVRWHLSDALDLAGGMVARSTPRYAHEVTGLLRLDYRERFTP